MEKIEFPEHEPYESLWLHDDEVEVDAFHHGNAIIEVITSKIVQEFDGIQIPEWIEYEVYFKSGETRHFTSERDAKLAAVKPPHAEFTSAWERDRKVELDYFCHKNAIIEIVTPKQWRGRKDGKNEPMYVLYNLYYKNRFIDTFTDMKTAKQFAVDEHGRLRPSRFTQYKFMPQPDLPRISTVKQFASLHPFYEEIICDEPTFVLSDTLFLKFTISRAGAIPVLSMSRLDYSQPPKNWAEIYPNMLWKKGIYDRFPLFFYPEDWNSFLDTFPGFLDFITNQTLDLSDLERDVHDPAIERFYTGVNRQFGNHFRMSAYVGRNNRPMVSLVPETEPRQRIPDTMRDDRHKQGFQYSARAGAYRDNDLAFREKTLNYTEAWELYNNLKAITKAWKRLLCGASMIYTKAQGGTLKKENAPTMRLPF